MGIVNYTYNRSTSGGEIITHLINSTDGTGLHFDGAAGTYVDCGDTTILDGATKISIEAIAATSGTAEGNIFTKSQAVHCYRTQFTAAGTIQAIINNGTSTVTATTSGTYNDGNPKHIVATWDNATISIYVNGNLDGTATLAGGSIPNTTDKLAIGAQLNSSTTNGSNFDGNIFRARLWNKSLTQAEVTASYENATVPFSDQYSSTASPLMSGTLTSGKLYRINTYVSGDDFTNLGGTNVTGNEFVTTGTTPTTWSNGSSLIQIGCTADYDLSFSNPTQSLMVQDRANIADGTSSATGVSQITPIEQLNSKSARIGTSVATPADGELLVSGGCGIGGALAVTGVLSVSANTALNGISNSSGVQTASTYSDFNFYGAATASYGPNINIVSTDGTLLQICRAGRRDGGTSNDVYLRTGLATSLLLGTNNTTRLTISSAGLATFTAGIVSSAMPTSDPTVAGQLWNDSGTVKISSG